MTSSMKKRITQIRHGQVPKGSKMTQLGIVPSDWDIVPIGDIGRIVTGSTPPTVIHDYYVGDRLFITPADFTEGIYVDNTSRTVSDSAYGVSRVIPPDSIYVVCIGATVGKTNMCRVAAICNQQINAIVPGNGFCNQFLYYCIDYFFNRTKVRYVGSQTLPIVSKNLFSRVGLALPPLAEQRKIAKILATQDRVIELKKKLLEETKKRKKALLKMLMCPTEMKRLEAASPCGGVVSCCFNEKWPIARIRDLFVPIARKNTIGSANILTISAHDGLVNQFEYYKHQYASGDVSAYTLLKKGEFAYNKSRSGEYPYGAIKMLDKYEIGVVSPLYLCFAAKDYTCLDFWSYYFEAGMLNRSLYRIAQEGARNHGLLNIPTDGFFELELIVPPLPIQRRIATILSAADREIGLLLQDLEQEERKKKALMQLLLTGIVRVKEAAGCRFST